MKTPENFNHNPNVGLTPMAKNAGGAYESGMLNCEKSAWPVSEPSNKGGEKDKSVLSVKANDVGGVSMAK